MDMEGLALLKNFNRDFFRKNLFWGKVRVGSEKEIDFRRTSGMKKIKIQAFASILLGKA